MSKQNTMKQPMTECCHPHHNQANGGGAVYGLGFVGALVYFVPHASGVVEIIMAVVKAIFWPALLVFRALVLLKV